MTAPKTSGHPAAPALPRRAADSTAAADASGCSTPRPGRVPGDWLDLDEAAAVLGVTRRWLADRVRARSVPHHRVGKHVRFTPSDMRRMEALFEAETVQTTSRTLHRRLRSTA